MGNWRWGHTARILGKRGKFPAIEMVVALSLARVIAAHG